MSDNKMKEKASCVLFVRFKNNPNSPRTFYSRDIDKKEGNVYYWSNHLRNLVEVKWKGLVQEYAIYRCVAGKNTGDPLFKVQYAHPNWVEPN